MHHATISDKVVRHATAQASNWHMASLLLERPTAATLETISSLAGEVTDPLISEAAADIGGFTEGMHLHLFGEGGFVSPRETTWRHREDPGPLMADIAGFHEAFAFTPRREQPIDHVAVEASFVGYLHLKEAYARTQGATDSAEIAGRARRQFIGDHLGVFLQPWADRVAESGIPHLLLTSRALLQFVSDELAGVEARVPED